MYILYIQNVQTIQNVLAALLFKEKAQKNAKIGKIEIFSSLLLRESSDIQLMLNVKRRSLYQTQYLLRTCVLHMLLPNP